MVQGIYNVKGGQPVGVVYFGEGGSPVYMTKAQEPDSFNGKTLLTIAALASAVIFRKNIAKFAAVHCPKVLEFVTKHIATPVKEFLAKHADNSIVKLVTKGWNRTGTWGDSITKWVQNTFNKPKIIQPEFDFTK